MVTISILVNWGADPVDPAVLERVACAGGAGGTVSRRLDGHIGMALTGEACGELMSWELACDGDLWLAADARIDNRDELAASLALPGLGADAGDAVLILGAWRRWGRDCARRLIGDFVFVVWDAGERRLFAACDPMHMKTLYYARRNGVLCLTSETRQLFACPGVTRKVRRLALAGWVAGWPDPDLSLFEDVEALPAGHSLFADRHGLQVARFWDLDPERRIRYRDLFEYEEHLGALLARCVTDRMRTPCASVATQMSGGMDSTSVTALAQCSADRLGKQLLVVSHSYGSVGSCDESDLIRETVERLGIRRHRFLPAERHAALDFRRQYPPALESPGTVCSPGYLDEMDLIRGEGARVLLTGSGGDELTWGHSLTYSRRLLRGDLAAFKEVLDGARDLGLPRLATFYRLLLAPLIPAPVRTVARHLLGREPQRPWPAWLPEHTARELGVEEHLMVTGATQFRDPALQARYEQLLRTSTFNSVRSYQQAGRLRGVEVRHPFFDRRLAEFSFAIPDDLWLRMGYPKWLLRRVMTGILPDSVAWKRQKVVFEGFFGSLLRQQAPTIRTLLADPRLQSVGLVDNARLMRAFDASLAHSTPSLTVDLLYAILTQVWVEKYGDEVEL